MPLLETKGAASAQGFGLTIGGVAPVYIEDVFSTWLYTGNGGSNTITNGIDLAGKGGLVWGKNRGFADNHYLCDSARGSGNGLYSNTTNAQASGGGTTFNSNGFSLTAGNGYLNANGYNFVSWTFRKQPKFFDVATFSQTSGSTTTFNHSLGSTPGCMLIKTTDVNNFWLVYHTSLGNDQYIILNSSGAAQSYSGGFSVSSTSVTINNALLAATGNAFVAYIFAHNAGGFGLSGTDNVISCGSYTGNGSMSGPVVTLGYEPQWVLVKRTDTTGNWLLQDNMRSLSQTNTDILFPNLSNAATTGAYPSVVPTATGFYIGDNGTNYNANGGTYIYIAIRRGPMRTPTTGTSVFDVQAAGTNTNLISVLNGVDLAIGKARNGNSGSMSIQDGQFVDRLRGMSQIASNTQGAVATNSPVLLPVSTAAEATNLSAIGLGRAGVPSDNQMCAFLITRNGNDSNVMWCFLRAPGFFDEVCYTGTSSPRTVAHNLTVVPELMIVKRRTGSEAGGISGWWIVYSAALGNNNAVFLNSTDSVNGTTVWNNTTPTSSVFTVNNNYVNFSGDSYVAYLFASCPGVSKVGSYTGNGVNAASGGQTINCGFTGGARFVLVKRTDSTGNWFVFDSARGIVAGADPYLWLNSTNAEVTTIDVVDAVSSGFIVNQEANTNLNVNGGTYIFLAIA